MLGKLVTQALQRLPDGAVLPIMTGPLRGARWSKQGQSTGYITGGYERDLAPVVASLIHESMTVFDIGAHHGWYTLLALLRGARVIAIEPMRESVTEIFRNVHLNGYSLLDVLPMTVSDKDGRTWFEVVRSRRIGDPGSTIGKLKRVRGHEDMDFSHSDRTIEIHTITIDTLAEMYGHPHLIRMDIEGAEALALDGGERTLALGRTTWIVSVHNRDVGDYCRTVFEQNGYTWRLFGKEKDTIIAGRDKRVWQLIPPAFREWDKRGDLYVDL